MIKLWRAFLVLLEMILFACGALFIGCVLFPILSIRKNHRKLYAQIIRKSWKFFIFVMEKSGAIKVNINGNLSDIKGKIVVASHPSFIDIILLIGNMQPSLCLAKKSILKNPVMRNIVKSLYIINDIDPEEFKKSAVEALNEGYNIVIFPTGTRTLPDEEIKIHKGAAQIAIASGVDIIPVKIETDYPFLIKNHFPLDANDKTVNYTLTVQHAIKLSDFDPDLSEIKLRNHISERIKMHLTKKI